LSIPIELKNRPDSYLNQQFFHPTFLYESLGNLLIFLILLFFHLFLKIKQPKKNYLIIVSYFILYSLLRFFLEFLRLDETALFLGLRWPQLISLLTIAICCAIAIYYLWPLKKKKY
jgi:phosphatidylglycerol:prolipoprotein diacylglycerol transferase